MMDLFLKIVLVALSSYSIGSIPSSFIMGKLLRKIDLREHGSGNLGAANTFRVLGFKAALPVLLFDIGKGFVAVRFLSKLGGPGIGFALLAALLVVIGHNYSVFVRFSGGKGVGATAGAFLALAPQALGMCVTLWILTLLATRIVSIASMASAAFLPFSIPLANRVLGANVHYSVTILAVAAAAVVFVKHASNIKRLREGTEKKIF
ncbi:MAG: glycerol-3-phosphate 1-O-acyltransferase PlsY [Candidatus Krumholzibacteria bacterium]|nr:glycerol-3-phosphate 1-O-acyltransferase PlsY [Candidatus Krumholzibacteria bacterium]